MRAENNILVLSEDILVGKKKEYNLIRLEVGEWMYVSPNGYIKSRLSLADINVYGNTSSMSMPTENIDKYPLIADDLNDFYKFQNSFQRCTVEQFIKKAHSGMMATNMKEEV